LRTGCRSVERRGGKVYVYYIHYDSKTKWKCYVGPKEGYTHAEDLHRLSLDNIEDVDYVEVAVNSINAYLRKVALNGGDKARKEAVRKLEKLIKYLQLRADELRKEVRSESIDSSVDLEELFSKLVLY